jgi:transcriptional regulator GlxA family with amidase domain
MAVEEPGTESAAGPRQVFGFLLLPGFSLLAFSSAIDPLRSANRLSGRDLYEWFLITSDGEPVAASNGARIIPDGAIDRFERLPNLIICAGVGVRNFADKKVFAWLRRLERTGCRMGAVSTASHVLAKLGMLDGHRCTIHWENLPGFREDFPQLDATNELFEIDRGRFTCSGGTASLDMMLALIAPDHGRALTSRVADQFMHERLRDQHDKQRMDLRLRLGISHPKLLKVVALMEAHLEEPLARADLATRVGLSTRQLERLFRKYLQRTPTRFYLELRLERARQLLTQTSLSVLDVALACGFVSASHFSKCYREIFKKTPREERLVVS